MRAQGAAGAPGAADVAESARGAGGVGIAIPKDMPFTKILCPTDFSPGAHPALRLGARLAAGSGAELVVAHVWHTPAFAFGGGDPFPAEAIARMVKDREHQLAAATDLAAKAGAPRVTSRFLTGTPWDEIVKAAQADPAIDLIVTGTHGRTGVVRMLLGSVTERVIRHAPCSVLAARPTQDAGFHHVLCPVDFSDTARLAVDRAAELAAAGGAGIVLLHVIELPIAYNGEPSVTPFLDDIERRTQEVLAAWAAELITKVKVPVRTELRIGNPALQALSMLDHDPTIDLVVVGSHGRTGIRRALLGSVAETIVRHATRPVLVARPRAA